MKIIMAIMAATRSTITITTTITTIITITIKIIATIPMIKTRIPSYMISITGDVTISKRTSKQYNKILRVIQQHDQH